MPPDFTSGSAPSRPQESYSWRQLSPPGYFKSTILHQFSNEMVFVSAPGEESFRTLTPSILVRIQVPQPIISTSVIRDSRKAETDHAPDRFLRRESEVQVRSGTRNRFADSGRPNCAQMAAAPRRDTNLDHYRPRVKLHSG